MWYFYSRTHLRPEVEPGSNDTVQDPQTGPAIASDAFTPVLGLLLLDAEPTVASWARITLVRFLCRLGGQPLPPFEDDPSRPPILNVPDNIRGFKPTDSATLFTPEAQAIVRQHLMQDIVLGLAHLDDSAVDIRKLSIEA